VVGETRDELWACNRGGCPIPCSGHRRLNSAALSTDGTILEMGETGGSLEQPVGQGALWKRGDQERDPRNCASAPENLARLVCSAKRKTIATSLYNAWYVTVERRARKGESAAEGGLDTSLRWSSTGGTTMAARMAVARVARGHGETGSRPPAWTRLQGAGAVALSTDGKDTGHGRPGVGRNHGRAMGMDKGTTDSPSLDAARGRSRSWRQPDGTTWPHGLRLSQETAATAASHMEMLVTSRDATAIVRTGGRLPEIDRMDLAIVPVGPSTRKSCAQAIIVRETRGHPGAPGAMRIAAAGAAQCEESCNRETGRRGRTMTPRNARPF